MVGAEELVGPPDAVELDRVVPPSGNLAVGRQQFWFGPRLAGQQITLWMDSTTVHISLGGVRVKTVPSRLNTADLAWLRRTPGSRPAGAPPAPRAAGPLAARLPIQVDRTANAVGVVSLVGTAVPIGFQHAGRRVTLRLDGPLLHLIVDGVLTRTSPPRSRPSSATGSATPASPDHSRPRPPGRPGCSARCLPAAASRSATSASGSA